MGYSCKPVNFNGSVSDYILDDNLKTIGANKKYFLKKYWRVINIDYNTVINEIKIDNY